MRSVGRWLAGAGALALLVAPEARAQRDDEVVTVAVRAAPRPPADSARVLKRARSAQSGFERVRRGRLPWMWGSGGGPCDEVVGRWCYRDDDVDGKYAPPPEPPDVARERARLLDVLSAAAQAIPGDEWVAGQLVRYLSEGGRAADAVAAAQACRGTKWWCSALAGYAHHEGWDYVAAESAFAEAVSAMPEEERARWTNLDLLLGSEDAKAYRRLSGEARDAAAARFWWLADPLWSLPGNDRLTEHYARLVFDHLQDRANTTEGSGWDDGLRQLLLRYGPPSGWRRVRSNYASLGGGPSPIVTYFERHGRDFLPPFRRLEALEQVREDEWRLSPRFARTRYAPAYAVVADSLPHQVALFRAGDSTIVIAAYDMPDDSVFLPGQRGRAGAAAGGTAPGDSAGADSSVEAAVLVASAPGAEPAAARLTTTERRASLRLAIGPGDAPREGAVVSLEALSRGSRRAARAREALHPAPDPAAGVALSDLLLITADEPLPAVLDEAVSRALGAPVARAGERMALYWETYGLTAAGASLAVSVALIPDRAGWLRRGIERLGVVDPAAHAEMKWDVPAPDSASLQHHSIALTLPDLPAGRYTMRVVVRQDGVGEAMRERRVWVRRE